MEYFLRASVGNIVAATLLAIVAVAVSPSIRRWPALRHCLWLLVLVKLVTPPLWTMPVAWVPGLNTAAPAPVIATVSEEHGPAYSDEATGGLVILDDPTEFSPAEELAFECEITEELLERPLASLANEPPAGSIPWTTVVLVTWLAGAVVAFGISSARVIRFGRLLKQAVPAGDDVHDQVEELGRMLGLRRCPRVCWMPGAVSPMVWALGTSPRLILPEGLWKRLDKAQRTTLLAHELAHLRRGDHWVRCLELVATALYWWFPVVWWTRRALREAEEQCCDAWVVWAFPKEARKYAEALLETVDYLSPAAPAAAMSASGLGHVRQLRRRLTMIMQGRARRSLHWSGSLLALGLSAALLPLAPTWAQEPERASEHTIVVRQPDIAVELVTDAAVASKDAIVLGLDSARQVGAEDVEIALLLKSEEGDNADKVKKQIDEAITKLEEQLKRAAGDVDSQEKKKALEARVVEVRAVRQAQDAERAAKAALMQQVKEQLKQAADGASDPKAKQAIEATIKKIDERLRDETKIRSLRVERIEKDVKDAKIGRREGLPELSPEKKAEIDKARAELEALRAKSAGIHAELKELSAKMRDAQARLSKLVGEARATQVRDRVIELRARPLETKTFKLDSKNYVVKPAPAREQDKPGPGTPATASERLLRDLGRADRSDQDRRLGELEKKLDRLADELAKLKKSKD